MLPALVITGFLGSGKTTLLINSAREYFRDKKVAIIVNELGEVGVDGKVLKNAYSEVLELPEGCICCTLHAEFEKAIGEIREKYNPEILLVETSGGAVPFPVILSLQALGCSVDGVICLVDCANFEKYKEDNTAKYQIGSSNVIVLNKIDLVDENKIKKVEEEVKEIWQLYRPVNAFTGEPYYTKVKIYKTQYGKLPQKVFEGLYTIPELKDLPHHHNHNYKQRVINLIEPLDYDELEKRLKSLPENIIRAKGIVRLKHYPKPVVINYAFGYLDYPIEISDYDGPSFLVLIEGG
ncbi:MAG: GTP-binding protein [Aquificaceae bacterium]|nr:GTP-binding protein [Aquificaceae bacterium]